MKLKSKASVVMAVTVVFALVTIGGAFYLFLEQSLRTSIYAGLESVANASADSMHRFVASSLRDARAVAVGLPAEVLATRDVKAAETYLARMCQVFPQFDNGIFILDAQGQLWVDHPAFPEVRGRNFASHDFFEKCVSTRREVVGRPYQSPRSKEPVCTFATPLLDQQGNLLGVLGCSVKLLGTDALGVLRHQAIGKTGYLYLIDRTRLMVMHPDESRILERDAPQGLNLLFDQALEGFEGVGETVNSRGVPMLVAFKRVPLTDWILAAQQPIAEAFAPLDSMRLRLLLGIAVGALLAVLAAMFVVRNISRPITDLQQATADLGSEPFPQQHPILTRSDEIGDLARAYQAISQDLQRMIAELRETEGRLRTAQKVAHIGSWELNLATRELWGSGEAGRIYGMPRDTGEHLPLPLAREVSLEEDRPRLKKAMDELVSHGAEYSLEYRIRRPSDGEIRIIHSRATHIPGQDGAPGRVVGTIQDVTERHKVEADIRRRTEELLALNALGRELNRDLSLQHTVQAALKGLLEALKPDLAFLFLRQGERLILQDIQPPEAGRQVMLAGEHRVGQCICGLAVEQRQALFSLDTATDQRCTWGECKASGVKSFGAIPLFGADEVMGVLGLASYDQRDFARQAGFLETLAGQVAVALTNARLFEKVQKELGQHQQTLLALRESQDRYRVLSDQSPLGISLIDNQGRYEYINAAFINIFGYTLADIPTRTEWFRLAYPDEGERARISAMYAGEVGQLQPGHSTSHTLEISCKDRSRKSILLRVVALSSGRHFIIYEDITERLRSEESLRQSEELFRRFIEAAPLAIAVSTPDKMEYLNPKFTHTFGYDQKDLPTLAQWWIRAYPDPDYRREIQKTWGERVRQAHSADTEVAPIERLVRCKDGSDKIIAFYGAPVGGKTIVFMLDMTAERQSDQALMESETKFRRFVEASPVGIHMYRHEPDGSLVFTGYNEAAERILGQRHGPLLGRPILEAFPGLASSEIPERYRLAAIEGEVWNQENITYEHGRIAGAYEVTAFQTAPGSMAVMFSDIAQRLRAQEDLRILEQQLARSQKLEALGTLASGIAHDFNNILQALQGRAELLAGNEELPDATRRHVENMQRSIARATSLVARMLTFSRSGESKLSVLDINHEVLSAVEMLQHALPRMVSMKTDLTPQEGLIMGDADRLEQIILNLATNARDAMPQGGSLLFRTYRRSVPEGAPSESGLPPGEYVALAVSDTGQGMDQRTLSRVFEPFFSTKAPGKGTGLGLYSVYGIIREHGGTITCQSRPGHGTTFTMIFPLAKALPETDQAASAAPAQAPKGSETLLVVDDEPEILEPLGEALGIHGYHVHLAASGEEALAILEVPGISVDLVLMDLNMPGMGGEKALDEIKARHPEARIILASGYRDRTLKEKLLRAGADHFIGKPFDFNELLAALRKVLARRRPAAEQNEQTG